MKTFLKKIRKIFYIELIKILNKKKYNKTLIEKENYLEEKHLKSKTTCYVKDRKNAKEIDLSIIIPIYNGEKQMNKCIDSVINNITKYNYEIILVDDGSDDNTGKIIKKYEKKYPKLIKALSKPNGGLSSARNYGIERSRGKYLSFIDHDDFIDEDYIEKMMDKAYKADADIVKCGTSDIDLSNNKIVAYHNHKYAEIKGYMKDKIFDYDSYAWGNVVKTELFKNVEFPYGYWYEDMIYRFLIYRQSKKFIYIGKILHHRGIHGGQLTRRMRKSKEYRCLEHLYLIENLVEANKKHKLPNDIYLYMNVLHECSKIMVYRIDGLDEEIKEQVFIRANKLISSLYKKEYEKELKGEWKLKSDIILNKQYNSWLLLKNI